MKTATELLAEMLAIYEDPAQDIHDLHSWIHQAELEVKGVVEGGDDTARLDWYEDYHYEGDNGSFRDSIDRARGEGE